MQKTSSSETASTNAMTTAEAANSWPQASSSGNSAEKATAVVNAPNVTGPATARTPASDASTPRRPNSRCLAMLSPITTASSTTMPAAMNKPNIVSALMLMPLASKNTIEPKNAMGMPIPIQNAMRRSKIASKVRNTSTTPMVTLRPMVAKRSEITWFSSCHSDTSVPAGGA